MNKMCAIGNDWSQSNCIYYHNYMLSLFMYAHVVYVYTVFTYVYIYIHMESRYSSTSYVGN